MVGSKQNFLVCYQQNAEVQLRNTLVKGKVNRQHVMRMVISQPLTSSHWLITNFFKNI